MLRLVVRTAIALAANAVGLVVAAALIDGFSLKVTGLVVAVVVFTVAFALVQPFLLVQLRATRPALAGGVALLATLVSLIVTGVLTDELNVSGIGAWIAGAVIVWLASIVAAFVLPPLGLKKYLAAST